MRHLQGTLLHQLFDHAVEGAGKTAELVVAAHADRGRLAALAEFIRKGEAQKAAALLETPREDVVMKTCSGQAELVAYGPFKRDAHLTLGSRDGVAVWLPATERFLQSIGMPVRQVYRVADAPPPPATHFAPQDDIAAVPYLEEQGRAAYRVFLEKTAPRAFALSASGAWGWAEEGESPDVRALASCQRRSSLPCQLYSVDESVVWPGASAVGGAQ